MTLVTATTGTVATSIAPALNQFSKLTSMQALFDEYRFRWIKWHVLPAADSDGTTMVYVDDEDANAPTLNQAYAKGQALIGNTKNAGSGKARVFTYKPQNFPDLEFSSCASASSIQFAALKLYSDTANFGNSNTTGNRFSVWYECEIEFRGPGGA